MPNNNINFQINYQKGDTSALDSLRKELIELKSLASNLDMGFSADEINQLLPAVSALERALNGAFDVNLNTINIQKFNQLLAQSGMNAKSLQQGLAVAGAAGDKAFLHMTAQLMQFNNATKQTNKFLDSIANSFFNTIKYTAFNTILNSISGTVQKAAGYVKSLDTSLNDIRIVTGKSADEMDRFAESANEAAKQLAVTTSDYTEGSLIYYQQGLDDETVKTLTDITAMTSNVTGQSMEAVSEQLTAVWNGYQVANQAAEEGMQVYQEYVDKMAAVGATTASDLQELATAMSKVSSAASSMGVNFDDLAAQIATIVSVTRQAPESVGTALKTIYARLGDLKVDGVDEFGTKLGEVSAQLQAMGISILDTNGDMRDMSSVMAEVASKWDTWTSAQKQAAAVAMAGKRQYNNLVALFDNWDMYGEALETSMNAAGTLEEQQEIALDSLANKMDILKATAEDLYDSLINEDTLKNGIEDLTKLIQLLADFTDATGGLNTLLPLLGSTALKVFNEQIANGLSTVIINLETANEKAKVDAQNMLELQSMFSNSALFEQGGSDSVTEARTIGLEKLKQVYGELYQYQSLMSKEEQEQYNHIVNLAEKAGTLGIELAEQKEAWLQIKNSIGIIDKNLITDISGNINQITEQIVGIKNSANELQNYIARFNQNGWEITDESIISFINHSPEVFKNASQYINLYNSTTGTAEQKTQALVTRLREIGSSTEGLVKLESEMNNAGNAADNLGERLRYNLDIKATISSITNTIGAIGQLASSFQMIQNMKKIWDNEDLSQSEKMTQSLINFTMVVSFAGSALKSLNNTFKITAAAQAFYTATTEAATSGVTGLAAAQIGLNAAMLASPLAPFIIVLGLLVSTVALVTYEYKKNLDKIQELNDAEIERVNLIQEETDSNEDLYQSYNKLYSQYKNGQIAKEELYDVTNQLCDKYENEMGLLAEMSGNYDALTKSIREARDAELERAQIESLNKLEAVEGNLLLDARSTREGGLFGSNFTWALINDAREYHRDEINEILKRHDINGEYGVKINANDSQALIKFYDDLTEAVAEARHELGTVEANADPWVQQMQNQIDAMKSSVDEARKTAEAYDNYTTQRLGNQQNLWDVSSLEEFDQKIKELRENLSETDLQSTQTVDDLIKTYLKNLDTNYSKTYLAIDALKEQVDETAQNYIDNLSEGEKEYLISGKVKLDFVQTKEDIEKEIEYSFQHMGTFDVEAPINFQTTLASGNKLKKADKEELSALSSENPEVMTGFDNKSILHQMETIDAITQYRIDKNIEFLNNYEESIQARIALDEQELQSIYKTSDEYEEAKKKQYELQQKLDDENNKLSYDDRKNTEEELKNINKKINAYETLSYSINDLKNDLQEGLSWNQVEDIGFSSLIADLESVTNKATAVQNAMELIGEGFKVAASDVEKFSNTFPELLENAEALSDGSLQLDKDIIQQNIEGVKAEMEARTQAKIAEVDQQIALKELEQKYLQEKLKNLELYLQGKQTEQTTIDNINKAGYDYETGLMELTGQEITNLEKHALAASNAEGSALVNMLDQVGKGFAQAANAHYAMLQGQPFDWTDINFSGASTSAQEYASSIGGQALELYQEAQNQYEQIFNEAQEVQSQLNTVNGELDQLKAQRAILQSTGKAASHAIDNVTSGKAGKDSKSSSGSSKDKDKELKKLEEEFDRYWEIHKALDQIDRDLKRMDKDQENLYGKELIRSLKQENELLANQSQLYEQLYAAQEQEAAELRGTLANSGVAFDASGAVLNYAEATAAALKEYNDAITAYNNGLLDDAALKIHEQKFEQFKKDLERYDTLFYTEMQDTLDKIDDLRRQTLANNLKAWEVEIQLKLDFKELEREWNDFIKEVNDDFKSVFKDLRVDLKSMLTDAKTYIGDEGTINTVIGAVHDVTGEIDKLMGGGTSDMFESVSQAQEKLKELNEELLDSATALHDLWEEAWDNYLEGIDQVADAFDDLIERFERINDELEFQEQIIELLYGDEAYALMNKLYEGQEKNTAVQLQSLKTQVDMWKDLFYTSGATLDNQLDWTEDQQKYYEQWMEAQSALNDLVIDYIELLKKDYLNTVSSVLQELEKYVTGSSLDDLNTEWERISDNADKYYDSVEGAYYIQTLANKIDQSIADADGLKAQQKLMALREKEIDYLREKETLTEYDIKAAELRYQIALKEIALEEAQNNKTGMKLTRNEQGNWSYQYVADETDVATKQQELLDAYNNLYQLASDAYEANLEALQELQEKYLESAKAIYEDDTLTEEERQAKLLELREWYLEQYRLLSEENQLYRNDLASSGAALLLEIYEQDKEAYESMTEHERELVNALINANIDDYMELEDRLKDNYQEIGDKAKEVMSETRLDWTSGAQTIADLWNKDGGWSVKTQVVKAYDAIEEANRKYKEAVDWCAAAVERNFSEEGIVGAIQSAEYETDSLRDKTVEMVNTAVPYLQELRSYVDQIGAAWQSVQQAIMDAISLIDEYLRKVGEANAAAAQQAAIGAGGGSSSTPSGTGSDEDKKKSGGGSDSPYKYYAHEQDGSGYISGTTVDKQTAINTVQRYRNRGGDGGVQNVKGDWIFDTGGYTGSWGNSSGRIAMLHQKELVLNADDTKNFLSGINTIRDLSSSVGGSIQDAVLRAVANTALSLGSIKANGVMGNIANNNSSTDNVFNITAEFPNANSVDDIREAILSLPNIASQYANSTLK